MKIYLLSILILAFVFSTNLFASDECTQGKFCDDKINTLTEVLDNLCFSKFVDTDDEMKNADNLMGLQSCMAGRFENWLNGYMRRCGGDVAQNACLNKCKSYSSKAVDVCLVWCSNF